MILLAIEQSTDIGSIAVLNGQNVLAEHQWTVADRHNKQLFEILPGFLREAALDLDDVRTYAVGLGPGSYTGLRMSLAAANAFALPDHRTVYGVSSAESLAWDVSKESQSRSVTIIGDARRQHLWVKTFICETDHFSAPGISDWKLITLNELPFLHASVIATSDWERIGSSLKAFLAPTITLIEGRRVPRAGSLGRLAGVRIQRHVPSDRLSPIYLHPSVSASSLKKNANTYFKA